MAFVGDGARASNFLERQGPALRLPPSAIEVAPEPAPRDARRHLPPPQRRATGDTGRDAAMRWLSELEDDHDASPMASLHKGGVAVDGEEPDMPSHDWPRRL